MMHWMGLVAVVYASLVRPSSSFATRFVGRTAAFVTTSTCLHNSRNPFTSFVGDVANSIMGGNTVDAKPQVGAAVQKASKTSWDELREVLSSQMSTEEERNFRQNLAKGYGPASPLHKVRLYDDTNKEEDIRVTFYRDSASWCPYCQKVWLTLEEKRIPYKVEKINMRCYGDKPATFLMLQPNGNIPVAVIDGKTYGQSNDILQVLEQQFPEHKSLKPPAGQEMKAQELLRLERQLFSVWMYWLTGNNPERFQGMFTEVLNDVERALNEAGPFFLGENVSIVDFMFAPFLERMAASLLYYKGFQMRVAPGAKTDFPAVNKWFDAMETLESYQLTKSDYYTHCWDLPPQLGGCTSEPSGEPYERAINGERSLDGSQGSWELPLQPHNGGVEPDWLWALGEDSHAPCREAVERISANHEAIVNFAARGAGRKGMPPFSASLADPNATPGDAVKESVDAFLKTTCMALLEGADKHETVVKDLASIVVKEGGAEFAQGVVDSLAYLRDRVGVPRDMKLPAARQLRAHLNWSIGAILDAQG